MIKFVASAPGALNLFGENVTCENHNGVMSSMNKYSIVKFNELPRSQPVIIFKYPQINMYSVIHISEFQYLYRSWIFDDTLSEQIREYISPRYLWDNERQKEIVHSFLYLLAYIMYEEEMNIEDMPPFQMFIKTQLQTLTFGGLASIAVCFAACFLHWSNLRRDAHHKLDDDDRAKIMAYSYKCNTIFSYCTFTSEVIVCTHGSMLKYDCNDCCQNVLLDNMPKMKVLVIDSRVEQDKTELIQPMEKIINRCPHIANFISDSIRIISATGFSVLEEFRDLNREANTYKKDVLRQEKKLFALIRMQQELNKNFVKFNDQIHTICGFAQKIRLSGKCADNRGRYAYIWLPSLYDSYSTCRMLLVHDFHKNNFKFVEVDLNCDGVKIE